jgi:hypothetical protein
VSSELLGSLLLFALCAGISLLGLLTPGRQSKEHRVEDAAKRRRETELEEVSFVAGATSLLPDAPSALRHLLERYTWQQLLLTIPFQQLEIELLRKIGRKRQFTLPNLRTSKPGPLELRAVSDARKAGRVDIGSLDSDIDSLMQEATTHTLQSLVLHNLVIAVPAIDTAERTYVAVTTKMGRRLQALDRAFSHKSDRFEVPKTFLSSEQSRSAIAEIVRIAIRE